MSEDRATTAFIFVRAAFFFGGWYFGGGTGFGERFAASVCGAAFCGGGAAFPVGAARFLRERVAMGSGVAPLFCARNFAGAHGVADSRK